MSPSVSRPQPVADSGAIARAEKEFSLGLAGIVSLFVLASVVGLDRLPVVWADEVTLNDPGRTWASTGQLSSSVFGTYLDFDRFYHWQPPGQAITSMVGYRLFGFSIMTTRIIPVLFAAGAIALSGVLARRAGLTKWVALAVAAAVAVDPSFVGTSRSGRMDAQALFFLSLALVAMASSVSRKQFGLSLLGGFSAMAAVLTHPAAVGAVAGLALGSILVPVVRKNFLPWFVVGATAVGVPYLVWALSNWREVNLQFISHGESKLASPFDLAGHLNDFTYILREYFLSPLALVLLVVPLVSVIRWRSMNDALRVLTCSALAGWFVNFLLLDGSAGFYQLYFFLPSYVLLGFHLHDAFVALSDRHRRLAQVVPLMAAGLLLFSLLTSHVQKGMQLASQWEARDYAIVEAGLAEVPAGCTIAGSASGWYAAVAGGSQFIALGDRPLEYPEEVLEGIQYLLLPAESSLEGFADGAWSGNAERIATFGEPMPTVLGLVSRSSDYNLSLYRVVNTAPCAAPQP